MQAFLDDHTPLVRAAHAGYYDIFRLVLNFDNSNGEHAFRPALLLAGQEGYARTSIGLMMMQDLCSVRPLHDGLDTMHPGTHGLTQLRNAVAQGKATYPAIALALQVGDTRELGRYSQYLAAFRDVQGRTATDIVQNSAMERDLKERVLRLLEACKVLIAL